MSSAFRCGFLLTFSCFFRLFPMIFSVFFVSVFLLGDVHKVENKYPTHSSKTVTRGEEEGVSDGDVLAVGEVVGLDQSLNDLLVTGGLPQKNAMFPPQNGYISSTISMRVTTMITIKMAKLSKLCER